MKNTTRDAGRCAWPVATFPSRGVREEFLDQVRMWNRVEGLPTIETEPLPDGRGLRFNTARDVENGVRRLIDSYGGWFPPGVAA